MQGLPTDVEHVEARLKHSEKCALSLEYPVAELSDRLVARNLVVSELYERKWRLEKQGSILSLNGERKSADSNK